MRNLTLLLAIVLCTVSLSTSAQSDPIDDIIEDMTLPEKIGQMFMVNLYGTEIGNNARTFIAEHHPGAVALFGYNTQQPTAGLTQFINDLQDASTTSGAGIPMIVAVDQEGGQVWRLWEDVTRFPEPMFLGAPTVPEGIEAVGAATGAELSAIGFNMNLAPVADLQTRTDTLTAIRVMHRRAWGDDPERVGWQTAAYVRGMAEYGVIGVLKHYPGHGGAADSHAGLPAIDTDEATARQTAFRSFEVAIEAGIPSIMVGHLYYSEIEPTENLPATLSPTLIGILRDDFGFEGVVMTDAMDMAGVANNFYIPDAALMFVQAGGDMFVAGPYMDWPTQRLAMARLIQAVEDGDLTEARIDASVRRILQLKADYGLLDWTPQDPETVLERIQAADSETALTEAFMDAATVVQDDNNLLPLRPDQAITLIYHNQSPEILAECSHWADNITSHAYNYTPAAWEYSTVRALADAAEVAVIFTEDAYSNAAQAELISSLPPEKTVVVSMSLPYDLETATGYSSLVALYDRRPAAQIAACRVLFGQHPATGRLPIALRGYDSGTGIDR